MVRGPNEAGKSTIQRAVAYARATGYPIQYQWTLIEGVNEPLQQVLVVAATAALSLLPALLLEARDLRRMAREARFVAQFEFEP